jgi:hypothetical protein
MDKNNKEWYIKETISLAMYIILPLIAFIVWVIFIPIVLWGGLMTCVNESMGMFKTMVIFSFPMIIFFALIPIALHIRKNGSLEKLGIKFKVDNRNLLIVLINTLLVIVMFYRIAMLGYSLNNLIAVFIQLLAIGISEEILCRGIIYDKIINITNNKIISIIISSAIFAFIYHSGESDVDNLLIRFPLGLTLGLLRAYTENIYGSILLHVWYNALIFTI